MSADPVSPADLLAGDRGGRLAAWTTAALDGAVSDAHAVAQIADGDESHDVVADVDAPFLLDDDLASLLALLRSRAAQRAYCVVPAPGDVRGLPGPARFNARAAESGAAVLVEGANLGLVPDVARHGPPDDCLVVVRWRLHQVQPVRAVSLALPTMPEARTALAHAVVEATDVLRDLGPRFAGAAGPVPELHPAAGRLPPGTSAVASDLLDRAHQVRSLVAAARSEAGGALTATAAGQRDAVLRALDGHARMAVAAAWNARAERAARSIAR